MSRALRSTFSSLREYLTPVSNTSSFQTTGEITPEEFVEAGDYLVTRFPTWSWAAASPGKQRSFLPEDKQYLVTKHVPCQQRATAIDPQETFDGDWVISAEPEAKEEAIDADLEGFDEQFDEDAPVEHKNDQERSYNIYITYSTSYRVPKLYLSGFDADGAPLPPKAMFEDIVGDYKDKTVTIEPAPFQDNLTLISIHPCRHAGVMRLLLDRASAREGVKNNDDDEWEEIPTGLRVDQYLVIFLKFIAGVTPTIEHDFTMAA